ncbi:hypothetical protein WA158_007115 [Blastocystis sp. Blastoise]
MEPNFDDLFTESQRLAYQGSADPEYYNHMNLFDMFKDSEKMNEQLKEEKIEKEDEDSFCTEKGIKSVSYKRNLDALNEQGLFYCSDETVNTDVDNYLRKHDQVIIESTIESIRRQMDESNEIFLQDMLFKDFLGITDKTSNIILNKKSQPSFKENKPVPVTPFTEAPQEKPISSVPSQGISFSELEPVMKALESESPRGKKGCFALASSIRKILCNDKTSCNINYTWSLIESQIDETNVDNNGHFISKKIYQDAFLDNQSSSESLQKQKLLFLFRTLVFANKEECQYIQSEVRVNQQLRDDTSSGLIPEISTYMNILKTKLPSKWQYVEYYSETPIWAILYYVLRCGGRIEDISVYKNMIIEAAPDHYEDLWTVYSAFLSIYSPSFTAPTASISATLEKAIKRVSIYSNRLKSFEQGGKHQDICLLYDMLGNFNAFQDNIHRDVLTNLNDYIWIRLFMTYAYNVLVPHSASLRIISINELSTHLAEMNPDVFGRDTDPFLYLFVLIHVQGYEEMIKYSLSKGYYILAINFALVFDYYGLLPIINSSVSLFCTCLQQVVTQLPDQDLPLFLLYIHRLRDMKEQQLIVSYILLRCQDPHVFIGTIGNGGKRINSLLDQIWNSTNNDENRDITTVLQRTAVEAGERGNYELAAILFLYSHEFTRTIDIHLHILSKNVFSPSVEHKKWHTLTSSLLESDLSQVSPTLYNTMKYESLHFMLQVSTLYLNLFDASKDISRASSSSLVREFQILPFIQQIIPSDNYDSLGHVQSLLQSLDSSIYECIPTIIKDYIHTVVENYKHFLNLPTSNVNQVLASQGQINQMKLIIDNIFHFYTNLSVYVMNNYSQEITQTYNSVL